MSEVGERSSKGLIQQEEAIHIEESIMPDEWTNEKHYLYLKSMEAMFVEQLYNNQYNLTDSGWRSRRKNQVSIGSSGESNSKPQTSTKIEVIQDGCRKNISVTGAQPGLDSADESRVLVDTPWNSHNIEVSDQNFVDKEDEPLRRRSHVSKKKRMKEIVSNDTTKDQVVPTAQSPTIKNPDIPYKEKESNCTNLQSTNPAEGGTS